MKIMYTPVNPNFTIEMWGVRGSSLHRHVSMMMWNSGDQKSTTAELNSGSSVWRVDYLESYEHLTTDRPKQMDEKVENNNP